MNPNRWEEITRSFDFTSIEAPGQVSSGQLISCNENDFVQSTETSNDYVEACGRVDKRIQKRSPGGSQTFSKCESKAIPLGDFIDTGDVQHKVIQNLCKVVKEKTEKIKVQEDLIDSLNKRLQSKSSNKENNIALADAELEVKAVSNTTDDSTLGKIVHLIDNLERRLGLVINFIQRKFPKDVVVPLPTYSDTETKQGIGSFLPNTWNKPPVTYPRPTYGSLMREIHCRHRLDASNTDNVTTRGNHAAIRRQAYVVPRNLGGNDMERRIQVLESLVVHLKEKIMRKVKSRRK